MDKKSRAKVTIHIFIKSTTLFFDKLLPENWKQWKQQNLYIVIFWFCDFVIFFLSVVIFWKCKFLNIYCGKITTIENHNRFSPAYFEKSPAHNFTQFQIDFYFCCFIFAMRSFWKFLSHSIVTFSMTFYSKAFCIRLKSHKTLAQTLDFEEIGHPPRQTFLTTLEWDAVKYSELILWQIKTRTKSNVTKLFHITGWHHLIYNEMG